MEDSKAAVYADEFADDKLVEWAGELLKVDSPKWEYLFYEYDAPFSMLNDTVKNVFNAYGADGWKLVQEHILRTERWTTYHRAIFIREKREN